MSDYAFESIGVSATAPGAGAAMAAVAGDSLRIRDSDYAQLLDVNINYQVAGQLRITSPLIHDNLVGLTIRTGTGGAGVGLRSGHLLPAPQRLTPQDTLSVQAIGSAVAGDVEVGMLQIFYENLAGICGNLIYPKDLMDRVEDVFMPRVTITGAGAGWTGNIAITALDDQLKANREYAWIGLTSQGSIGNLCAVGMISPDWGNLRIACPLLTNAVEPANYFRKLSDQMMMPLIPVFNASQKDNVILSVLGNENAATANLSLVLALLRTSTKGRNRK